MVKNAEKGKTPARNAKDGSKNPTPVSPPRMNNAARESQQNQGIPSPEDHGVWYMDDPNLRHLDHPSDLIFLDSTLERLEDDDDGEFKAFQDFTEVQRRTGKMCLFRILFYKYNPVEDWRSSLNKDTKSKGEAVERTIWLLDLFGRKGNNLAVILITRKSKSKMFEEIINQRDDGSAGTCYILV